jgi:uncharacterized protein involved in type VI secretion and phage assembly
MLGGLIARFRNVVRQESQMATSHLAFSRAGIVKNYDPDRHSVRVLIQPEGILTGYIPVKEPWVGNGWGMYAPPSIGDVVDVHFLQGSKDSSGIEGRYYSARTKPLSVPSGEFWLVHKNGQYFKFKNDGTIQTNGTWNHTGDLHVTGNITATQDITDHTGTTNESMRAMRTIYDAHVHPPGSVPPSPQM